MGYKRIELPNGGFRRELTDNLRDNTQSRKREAENANKPRELPPLYIVISHLGEMEKQGS